MECDFYCYERSILKYLIIDFKNKSEILSISFSLPQIYRHFSLFK